MLNGDIYLYSPPWPFPSLPFLYFISLVTDLQFLDQGITVKERHFYLGIALLIILLVSVHIRHLEPGRLHLVLRRKTFLTNLNSAADPDPGSCVAILTPGSGMEKNPDTRSEINIPDHNSESLESCYYLNFKILNSLLRIRIRDPVPFLPWIPDKPTGSYSISESFVQFIINNN